MADDITLPGTGSVVETQQQSDGSQRQVITLGDVKAGLDMVFDALAGLPLAIDPASGRLRVLLDATGGAQTLGTITTVGTVTAVTTMTTLTTCTTVSTLTNQAQMGGILTNGVVLDSMANCWSNVVRGRIT